MRLCPCFCFCPSCFPSLLESETTTSPFSSPFATLSPFSSSPLCQSQSGCGPSHDPSSFFCSYLDFYFCSSPESRHHCRHLCPLSPPPHFSPASPANLAEKPGSPRWSPQRRCCLELHFSSHPAPPLGTQPLAPVHLGLALTSGRGR